MHIVTTQGSKKLDQGWETSHAGALGKPSNNFVIGWTPTPKETTSRWGRKPNTTLGNNSGWGRSPKSYTSASAWGNPNVAEKSVIIELSDSEPARNKSKKNEIVQEDSNDTQSFTKIAKENKAAVQKQDINRETNEVMMENLKATWNKEPGTIEDLVAENEKKRKKVVENEEEVEDFVQDEWGKNRKRQKLLDIG